jgi:hypothetical protein
MSVLDDLFSAAAALNDEFGIAVNVSIAISPSSPLPGTNAPGNISFGWSQLTYTPAKTVLVGKFLPHEFPPFFEGDLTISVNEMPGFGPGPFSSNENIGLTISAPPVEIRGSGNYTVAVAGLKGPESVTFTPQVDPTTNVVYGAAGTSFVAISLSGPVPGEAPPQ